MKKNTNFTKIGYVIVVFMLSIVGSWAQCNAPTNPTISAITTTGAQFSWTAAFPIPANGYLVEVRTSGAPGNADAGLKVSYEENSSATSVTIGDLDPAVTYTAYIKSICLGLDESGYSNGVVFTTNPLGAPTALPATNPTSTSFTAKWIPLAGANNYQIQYAKNAAFGNPVFSSFAGNVGSHLIYNLESEVTYYYKVRARKNQGAWGPYSNTISVVTTNQGATEAIWENGEWTAQPTLAKAVIIRDDFNSAADQFGSSLQALSLTVDAGSTFTLASGTYARVNTTIVNNAGADNFIVESNANLYQYSAEVNNTPITVNRESFPIYKLDYTMWSSPVEGQNLLDFSPATLPNRFYNYNVATNIFNVVPNVANQDFEMARGYLVRAPNNWPAVSAAPATSFMGTFKGKAHNGPVTVDVLEGFNMIGNPYPTDISADGFIGLNADNGVTGMWFWRRRNAPNSGASSSYYAVFNGFGGTSPEAYIEEPDGIVKVGQGFLVDVKPNTGSDLKLKFNKDIKVEDIYSNNFYRSTEPVERHKLWLNLTNTDGVFSQALMGFASNAEDGVEKNDARYIADAQVALTSLLDNKGYSIQAKALPFDVSDEFALRMQTDVAGTFTITLSKVFGMFDGLVDPLLVDTMTNTTTNLSNTSYTFTTEAGINDTRFKIVFQETALSTVDNAVNANAVIAINNNGVLNINAGSYIIKAVEIYDLLGRRIYTASNVDATMTSISNVNAKQQVILVKIATDHGTVTKKVQF